MNVYAFYISVCVCVCLLCGGARCLLVQSTYEQWTQESMDNNYGRSGSKMSVIVIAVVKWRVRVVVWMRVFFHPFPTHLTSPESIPLRFHPTDQHEIKTFCISMTTTLSSLVLSRLLPTRLDNLQSTNV